MKSMRNWILGIALTAGLLGRVQRPRARGGLRSGLRETGIRPGKRLLCRWLLGAGRLELCWGSRPRLLRAGILRARRSLSRAWSLSQVACCLNDCQARPLPIGGAVLFCDAPHIFKTAQSCRLHAATRLLSSYQISPKFTPFEPDSAEKLRPLSADIAATFRTNCVLKVMTGKPRGAARTKPPEGCKPGRPSKNRPPEMEELWVA